MNWLKHKTIYFVISLAVILPGVYSLLRFGLNPSVEFTGGSILELRLENPNPDLIRETIDQTIHSINQTDSTFSVKLDPIDQLKADEIKNKLNEKTPTEILSFTSVGPSVGKELLIKALTAIAIAATLTLLYIAYTFKSVLYGISAIVAMLHDTAVLLGTFSILGVLFNFQIDLLFVTAVLTTLSFSVHDTIVVFDRIRELHSKNSHLNLEPLANQALTETMVRSVNNSLTIIFMLLALVLLGGATLKIFAVALLIGAITGTYSSPFTAVPILVLLSKLQKS